MIKLCILETNTLITLFGVFIAILAFIATILCVRYQIITLINTQLGDKARECNKNLDINSQVPKEADKTSGIVSAILDAERLLDYQIKCKKYHILVLINKQSLIDQFYFQLHTSIRELLKIGRFVELKTNDSEDENIQKVNIEIKAKIQDQLKSCIRFLKTSMERDRTGYFDKNK